MSQRTDLKASLVFLAIAVGVCLEAARLGFGSIFSPDPGFFPWLGGIALAGLSLCLFGQACRGRRGDITETQAWSRPAILIGALLVYVPLLEPIGYPLATTALCAVTLRVLKPRGWPLTLGASAAIAVGTFLLFRRALGVELPPGFLAFLG